MTLQDNDINKYYAAGFIAVFCWGTTYAISKKITPDPLSSLNFTVIRTVFGFVSLFTYLILSHKLSDFIEFFKKYYKKAFIISLGLYVLTYIIQYWAISFTSATHQTIIGSTQTYWVILFNLLFLKQKPKKTFFMGALLATLGVIIVILSKDASSAGSNPLLGDLFSIVAFALWGGYTFVMKRVFRDEPPLLSTVAIIFCATIVLIPLSLAFNIQEQIIKLNYEQWGYLIWLGVASIGLAFLCYTYALTSKKLGAENIAILNMLQPIIGIITSVIILKEIITWNIIIGLILVLCGLYLSTLATKNQLNMKNNKKEGNNNT
jgi:drug/metabolite transporter (DMT)-like permease